MKKAVPLPIFYILQGAMPVQSRLSGTTETPKASKGISLLRQCSMPSDNSLLD